MQKPESVLENEMHKILLDCEVQTDHPIPMRKPNLVLINKRKRKLYVTIQLSVNTVLMSKNCSISNNSVKHKHAV